MFRISGSREFCSVSFSRIGRAWRQVVSAASGRFNWSCRFAANPAFNDLRFSFDTGGLVSTALNMGASSPIDIQIQGGTTEQALHLAKEMRNRIADVPGAADVRILQRLDAPYLIIDVNRQKAADQGLSAEDVILQVVAAMNSSVSINRNFWIDTKSGNQYFVGVQYPEDPQSNVESVLNVVATGTNQPNPVKLGSLVTIGAAAAPNLFHFVCENGTYEANGGHPIPGRDKVDFAGFARAAGYRVVHDFSNLEIFEQQIGAVLSETGPVFADLKISSSGPQERDYSRLHGPQVRQAFRDALAAS